RPFTQAREFARALSLTSETDWRLYTRRKLVGLEPRPDDVPADPHSHYEEFLPFREARAFARSLGLCDQKQWALYSKGSLKEKGVRPARIPALPGKVYRDLRWLGYCDWLGVAPISKRARFRPFEDAREFARSLGLRTTTEWSSFSSGRLTAKRPRDIPSV